MRPTSRATRPRARWQGPLACLFLATAAPVAAAVHCFDAQEQRYTLTRAPGPGYSFFVRCEALAADAPSAARRGTAPLREVALRWPTPPAALHAAEAPTAPSLPAVGARRTSGEAADPAAAAPGGAMSRVSARVVEHAPLIRRVAQEHGLHPSYLKAVMHVESAGQTQAVSPKGAAGLMQLMPATARRFGVQDPAQQLFDPEVNVRAAARYLSHLRRLFNDDWVLITAAYNAGEGAVQRHGNRVPPFAETQDYVVKVDQRLRQYLDLSGTP